MKKIKLILAILILIMCFVFCFFYPKLILTACINAFISFLIASANCSCFYYIDKGSHDEWTISNFEEPDRTKYSYLYKTMLNEYEILKHVESSGESYLAVLGLIGVLFTVYICFGFLPVELASQQLLRIISMIMYVLISISSYYISSEIQVRKMDKIFLENQYERYNSIIDKRDYRFEETFKRKIEHQSEYVRHNLLEQISRTKTIIVFRTLAFCIIMVLYYLSGLWE